MALPVVYVCENNLYGEFTPWEDVTAGRDRRHAREALGIPTETVDGNDVWTVRDAAARGASSAPATATGPRFIEALTYRFVGHSRSDPGALPQARRARRVDASATRCMVAPARRLTDELGARRVDQLDAVDAVGRGADRADRSRRGLAAPYPTPGPARQFKE